MIVPFKKPTANLGADKKHLANTVMDLFAGRPHIDKMLAISAGHRALERGTPFFDAVEIAEGVLNVWDEIEHLTRRHLMVRRNRERLTEYRTRRSVFLRPPCG